MRIDPERIGHPKRDFPLAGILRRERTKPAEQACDRGGQGLRRQDEVERGVVLELRQA